MGREEQIEEREVLNSIFPDEITGSLLIFRTVLLIKFLVGDSSSDCCD